MNGRRLRIVVAAATLILAVITPWSTSSAQAATVVPDAYLYLPIDGGRAVVRWNGQAKGYPVERASVLLPGRFDSHGAGVFIYRRGRGPDAILRVRTDGGTLALSKRTEIVNDWYEPLTGDFDGNGYTDIFWKADQWHTEKSYLWSFHADGSHTSVHFDDWLSRVSIRVASTVDANADGITDLLWFYDDQIWFMQPDGSHIERPVGVTDTPGWTGAIGGNLGPDDGITRRRMVGIYEGDYERLYTFNKAGQSTMKEIRPHVGNCCKYQDAVAGHFRNGYTTSLFFYSAGQPQFPELMQSITAGGNISESPAPQISGRYTTTVGDFDGNGFDDILLSSRVGATYLFSSDGTSFTKSDPPDVPEHSWVIALPVASS